MDLQLDDVALFVRIVEGGSLSAAARERDAPVSKITRSLARLEQACGARLLHRSTHGLSLTDEGDTFLVHARRLLETSAELQADLTGRIAGPSGWVRVSVSAIISQAIIAPSLASLYERHPQIHVDIAADDRMTDMAREGIDIAIRTGSPNSETVVAREIGQLMRGLYASPAYLARWGVPAHPDELTRHRLIGHSANPVLNTWQSDAGPSPARLQVQGHTRTDNSATTLALAAHGLGIARIMTLAAQPLVARGELMRVLPDHFAGLAVPMYAVILQERHRLPKIRACIDHWAQWMRDLDRPLTAASAKAVGATRAGSGSVPRARQRDVPPAADGPLLAEKPAVRRRRP